MKLPIAAAEQGAAVSPPSISSRASRDGIMRSSCARVPFPFSDPLPLCCLDLEGAGALQPRRDTRQRAFFEVILRQAGAHGGRRALAWCLWMLHDGLFEFCLTCFTLRLSGTDKWLGEDPVSRQVVAANDPLAFYRWRAGTYGWPGNYTKSIIAQAQPWSLSESASESPKCLRASDGPARFEPCKTIPTTDGEWLEFQWHVSKPLSGHAANPFLVHLSACLSANGGCQVERPLFGRVRGGGISEQVLLEVVCDDSCGKGADPTMQEWSPVDLVHTPSDGEVGIGHAGEAVACTSARPRALSGIWVSGLVEPLLLAGMLRVASDFGEGGKKPSGGAGDDAGRGWGVSSVSSQSEINGSARKFWRLHPSIASSRSAPGIVLLVNNVYLGAAGFMGSLYQKKERGSGTR